MIKWFKAFSFLVLGMALMMALGCQSLPKTKRTICLAENGVSLIKVVLNSTNAIPAEKTAARELTTYLEKITGAKFEVIEEKDLPSGVPAIYLGVTKYAGAQGVDFGKLSSEESVLRTVGKNLILAGGRPRGTLYAVYEFLENDLDCRWYTPWCEKAPSQSTCSIPVMDQRVKPYFMFRSQYTHIADRFFAFEKGQWKMFNARNRLNETSSGSLDESVGGGISYGGRISGGHGFAPYLPTNVYFIAHPEYYSMRAGKRAPSNGIDGNHACLSNPDVLKIITDEVKKDIAADREKGINALCYTVAVNDGGSSTLCDCAPCREMAKQYGATEERGTDAGLLLWFVNQVADAIKSQYPDKYIRTLAYGPAGNSPMNIRARDNVIVQVCGGPRSEAVWLPMGTNSFELAKLKRWKDYAAHIWLWDYAGACYHQPAFFRPITWKMDEQMKFFKSLGSIAGLFQENEIMMYEDSFFTQFYEMNMWIYAQLCRNPDREVNALASDFIMGYYGKAGPALLNYLGLVRSRLPGFPFRTFDFVFMTRAQKSFDEAEAAVADNPELLGRVKELRIQLDLAALVWRNSIIADYLAKGGKLEQYPWRIPILKARLLATLDASRNLYVCGKAPRYAPKQKDHGDIPILTIVRRYIDEVSGGVDYTPLPKELAALPFERVIDLTAPLFAGSKYPIVVEDPQATLGLAVPRMNTNECPMNISYWSGYKPNAGGTRIAAKDVKGKGYHLYQGPRFKLNEWTFIYLTSSWQLQRHLYPLYDPANTNQQWDVYLSMKYTGPAYPFGDPGEPNGLFIDRLILVKVE